MHLPGGALAHAARTRLDRLVGGPARRKVVVTLACVLALDSADKATVGVNAEQLQAGLSIGRAQVGLLLTVTSLVGALATLPAGKLVDRVCRTRLLAIAVLCWGGATLLSGFATSYLFLLLTRLALGIVTAVAGPATASLVGDFFPEEDRARIWGYVLSGELIGAGFGFVIAGQFAVLSWRAPFLALVPPSAGVCWLLRRLPEPERGGGTEARRDADLSLWEAIKYVLRVRTNVVLIVASALGYFFFSGIRGFAVEFAKHHYAVSQSVATSLTLVLGVGALGGVLVGGRLADRLLRRGRTTARVEVSGWAVLAAAIAFVPALITTSVWAAVGLLLVAAAFLGAANPPLDAARLDIIQPWLWGRAEAARTVLRNAADAAAPVLFGVLAESVFGRSTGIEYTFLIALVALFVAAALVLTIGRRTYPADAARVRESR
jgi:predicted MFS family arabinose efflux permease